jgi:hypothetical protein
MESRVRMPRDKRSDAEWTEVAAEIARLEALFGKNPIVDGALIPGQESPFALTLAAEIRKGPVADFLEPNVATDRLALLHAKALLAAHDERKARKRFRYPWLIPVFTFIVAPVVVGIVAPQWVHHLSVKHDAVRRQADMLLVQLSTMVVRARELQSDVARAEQIGINEDVADHLRGKAVEVEKSFLSAVQLHDFEGVAKLREAELRPYFELRALQECLQRAVKQTPNVGWRNDYKNYGALLVAASAAPPCATEFDVTAFDDFTTAVNIEIESRIGGSLFPRQKAAPETK